ncbi:MAG: 3-phosphoshikimate 1-carboxyvinyltransferase [Deltaproteobacteria bacterium]|nr:3-phosphoshikimate 1-carboxyvinyltransferase [Deltaproteobacteria bacterium]
MNTITLHPTKTPLTGTLQVPGDKSISHRAIIFSALSEQKIRIQNLLEGEDVLCTIDCFRKMGVCIEKQGDEWRVQGVGLRGLKQPSEILYCGNSGTTTRLLMGILAAQNFESKLSGDASLNKRPMKRVMEPLSQMGAQFSVEGEGTAHRIITVKGGHLKGIDYTSPVASAQVKTALLLAGLWAEGETSVTEPSLSRDHTERILRAVMCVEADSLKVSIQAVQKITLPELWKIPGDFSSAAFFIVAASIVPGSEILIPDVNLNPTRSAAAGVLKKMGAKISFEKESLLAGEEMGDIRVSFAPLHATPIQGEIIPWLIDEIPILCIAASQAEGETIISDAAELRVKESDRIEVMCNLLSQLGVSVEEIKDGLKIKGKALLKGARVQSFLDHRIAMSMAIAAWVADGPMTIEGVESVLTSFPGFWEIVRYFSSKPNNYSTKAY